MIHLETYAADSRSANAVWWKGEAPPKGVLNPTDSATAALRAAQTALGVAVDGKWGPKTEDAIQRALVERSGCVGAECGAAGDGEVLAEKVSRTGVRVLKVAAGITAGVAAIAGIRYLMSRRKEPSANKLGEMARRGLLGE